MHFIIKNYIESTLDLQLDLNGSVKWIQMELNGAESTTLFLVVESIIKLI